MAWFRLLRSLELMPLVGMFENPLKRVDWLNRRNGGPVGKPVKGYRSTGIAAGDATPGGARRRSDVFA